MRDILGSDGTENATLPGSSFFSSVMSHRISSRAMSAGCFSASTCNAPSVTTTRAIESYRQADYFGIYAFLQRLTAFRDNEKNISLVGETAVGKSVVRFRLHGQERRDESTTSRRRDGPGSGIGKGSGIRREARPEGAWRPDLQPAGKVG